MGNPNNLKKKRGRGRKFLTVLGGILAVLLILLIVGALREPAVEAADARANPPPGKLVDVGGYRLHIHCTGAGSPTVVFDSGFGDASVIWGWVQPEVAKTTRACSYDRAGMGWSEPSPSPRTARQFAKELHTLLANAGEPGPYLLVGHSLGGYTVRVYAHDYPDDVAGLVLVDAQDVPAPDAPTPGPAPKPGKNSLPALLARVGLLRALSASLGGVDDLPPAERQANEAFGVTPRHAQAYLDEGLGMAEGGAQARAVTTLGDLPVTVLTRGKNPDAKHTAAQAALLQLSTNSRQVIAEKSGHYIQIEQPEIVIGAIQKMVEQARK